MHSSTMTPAAHELCTGGSAHEKLRKDWQLTVGVLLGAEKGQEDAAAALGGDCALVRLLRDFHGVDAMAQQVSENEQKSAQMPDVIDVL